MRNAKTGYGNHRITFHHHETQMRPSCSCPWRTVSVTGLPRNDAFIYPFRCPFLFFPTPTSATDVSVRWYVGP
jgi:hypothetical protein